MNALQLRIKLLTDIEAFVKECETNEAVINIFCYEDHVELKFNNIYYQINYFKNAMYEFGEVKRKLKFAEKSYPKLMRTTNGRIMFCNDNKSGTIVAVDSDMHFELGTTVIRDENTPFKDYTIKL